MESRVLLIGNFLSRIQGTVGPTELMGQRYRQEGKPVTMASSKNNKVLRLLEMSWKTLLGKYDTILIDVYSSTALMFANITSYLAYLRKKKIVLVLHGGGLADVYKEKISYIDNLFSRATYIVTPSQFLKNFFVNHGFDVQYVPNTIKLDLFTFKKQRPNKHRILWVRAFTKNYNPDVAVRTFNEVLRMYPDATMTMVGPDKGNLREIVDLIRDLNLEDKIHLTGRVENSKLPEYYQNHDVYLNTTSYESFGVALLEAAACGLPIVSTSVGEIPLIWSHGKDILLSKDIVASELAEQISVLFEQIELYNTIQLNALKKSRTFSCNSVSGKWNELFGFM